MLSACKTRPYVLSAGVTGKTEVWEANLWKSGRKKNSKAAHTHESQAEILASRLSRDILTLM